MILRVSPPEARTPLRYEPTTDFLIDGAAMLQHEMDELRLRTARELHDGILQVLAGAALQIEVARRLLATDPEAADRVLQNLGASVAAEQQEMRLYVDEMKGKPPVWTDGSRRLPERLEAALERVGAIWGVETTLDARVTEGAPGEFGRQILRIVQEATVNAARHGGARSVSVRVDSDPTHVTITVRDDGDGFPFKGHYDHEALRRKRLGPLSLKHRVEDVGGRIAIDSVQGGTTVTVRLPWPREGEEG